MQDTPRAPVGYGQGSYVKAETPKLSIRIRSGAQVGRGGYVGGEKRPVAFVWLEEEAEVPERELVVRADDWNGYLLLNGSPVTLSELYPDDKAVKRLDKRLADWQRYYQKHFHDLVCTDRFYWGRFHEEGRRLARELQAVLIDRAVVRYFRPIEDPQCQHAPEIGL